MIIRDFPNDLKQGNTDAANHKPVVVTCHLHRVISLCILVLIWSGWLTTSKMRFTHTHPEACPSFFSHSKGLHFFKDKIIDNKVRNYAKSFSANQIQTWLASGYIASRCSEVGTDRVQDRREMGIASPPITLIYPVTCWIEAKHRMNFGRKDTRVRYARSAIR